MASLAPTPPIAHGLLASDLEADAARWVRRKLGAADHERRVLATAGKLFDLTRPLLNLTDADSELLRLAALLHDVGRAVSDKNHPAVGAEMIEQTNAVDLPPALRRRLAFLTRYHRGAVPPPMKEEHLIAVDSRQSLRTVLALLRTADALDHRRNPATRLLLRLDGRRLSVGVTVAESLADARRVYKRRKKYRLLESFLGPAVRVSVELDG
ncbi:MAG: HD domain-containing protein [Tepidisphaeraceae bacterium]